MTDDALIRAAQAGDADAFERLPEAYYDTLYRFAYRWSGNRADAEDITQQADAARIATERATPEGRARELASASTMSRDHATAAAAQQYADGTRVMPDPVAPVREAGGMTLTAIAQNLSSSCAGPRLPHTFRAATS